MRLTTLIFLLSPVTALAGEIPPVSGIPLQPERGMEIGEVYQSWLSPHQEGGEEEDTPALVPDVFKSTAPSLSRDQRKSRGHGTLAFTRDYSRAYVHVKIEGVDPEEIVMFHIHCGRPGQLGPILIDLGIDNELTAAFGDQELSVELDNSDIEAVVDHGHGLVGAFTAGCPIIRSVPLDKVKTIAGMATIAAEGELYFNLHTKGQTFFGDIRGQLMPVK